MSNEEAEWKTIRVEATIYYKLAELKGIFSALFGGVVPMSVVAGWAISTYHDETYPKLKEVLMNPDAIERFRKEVGGKLKRIFEVIEKPTFK